ncbi:MAG: hypothetical protein J7485_01745 [Sphingobium sp.]|nr:hypothetical protein [Sphingobium sp.]
MARYDARGDGIEVTMMRFPKPVGAAFVAGALLLLPSCVTKVVTAPIKATAKAADWATTSGDEADRSRGRELRRKCKERYDPYFCEST